LPSTSATSGIERHARRAPLLRQSLDCFLGIAPRDAELGVLSGRTRLRPYPGLKPWAVLLDHFMVKISVTDPAGEELYAAPNNFLTAALCAA